MDKIEREHLLSSNITGSVIARETTEQKKTKAVSNSSFLEIEMVLLLQMSSSSCRLYHA